MLALCDAVDGGNRHLVPSEHIGRPLRGVQGETDVHEFLRHGNEVFLVLVSHRQIGTAFGCNRHFGGQTGLEVGKVGTLVRAVDFAGRLHLRARCRVEAAQFDEREHRRFDADLS